MSLALTEFALHLSRLRWPPNKYFSSSAFFESGSQATIVTKLLPKTTIFFAVYISCNHSKFIS